MRKRTGAADGRKAARTAQPAQADAAGMQPDSDLSPIVTPDPAGMSDEAKADFVARGLRAKAQGVSFTRFAKANGIPPATFTDWRRKFGTLREAAVAA